MKKILILSAFLMLPACACFQSDEAPEERVVYTRTAPAPQNCDYFDGQTCYRYMRRHHVVAVPEVVRYRESRPAAAYVQCSEPAVPAGGSCAPKIRETREPVEIVYKKTTYKTVYEPKTFTSVSYERSPYVSARPEYVFEPAPRVEAKPEYVEVDSDEEILLNVK